MENICLWSNLFLDYSLWCWFLFQAIWNVSFWMRKVKTVPWCHDIGSTYGKTVPFQQDDSCAYGKTSLSCDEGSIWEDYFMSLWQWEHTRHGFRQHWRKWQRLKGQRSRSHHTHLWLFVNHQDSVAQIGVILRCLWLISPTYWYSSLILRPTFTMGGL